MDPMRQIVKRAGLLSGLIGLLISFAGPTYADDNRCDVLYEIAVDACYAVRSACTDVQICENISSTCTQNTDTEQGCAAFGACVMQNTPTFYRAGCHAGWNARKEQCESGKASSISSPIPTACPGGSPDTTQRCESQQTMLDNQITVCRAALREFHMNAGCPDRPSITVKQCKML